MTQAGAYGSVGQESVQALIGVVEEASARLAALSAGLGGRADGDRLRREALEVRSMANAAVQRAAALLQAGTDSHLTPAFGTAVSQLKVQAQHYLEAEGRTAVPVEEQLDLREVRQSHQQQQLQEGGLDLVEVTEVEVDNRVIEERNEQLHLLHSRLEGLRDVTADVALLTDVQDATFHAAELSADKASRASARVLKQLDIAARKQAASRYKMCCMLAIILAGLLVVAGIIAARIGIYAAAA